MIHFFRNLGTFFPPWLGSAIGPRPSNRLGVEITLRHTTLGGTPLEK